jgi:hypothetical protein
MNYREIMNFMVQNSPANLPPQALAEIFDRMIWVSSDNGGEIIKERNEWLSGEYRYKILVALSMNEVIIDSSLLDSVLKRFPNDCDVIKMVEKQK